MAKTPTITFYNYATGAANSVRDGAGTDHASPAATNIGDSGFGGISFSTATAGGIQVVTHYTADDGW